MSKNKKIFLMIVLFIVGFIVQIVGYTLLQLDAMSTDSAVVLIASSTIPFAVLGYLLTTILPKELKIVKNILYGFIILFLIVFVILCIASVVTDLKISDYGGITFW